MIIVAVIISAGLLFICMAAISQRLLRILLSSFFALLVLLTTGVIILNDHEHFGLQQVALTKTYQLSSSWSSSKLNVLLYQKIGSGGQEKVYLYKIPQNSQLQQTITDPAKSQVKISRNSAENTLQIKTIRWQYRSNFYRLLFGIAGNEGQLVKKVYTFKLGNDWLTLSTKLAKQLLKTLKATQKSLPKATQQYAAKQAKKSLAAALQKDPTLSATKQQQLSQKVAKKAATEYQLKLIKQLIKQSE